MIAPGAIVLATPFAFGIFLGPYGIAGLIPGAFSGGLIMAVS